VRILKAIAGARLDYLDESQMSKIVPLATALGQHRLGLDDELYEVLRTSVTTIIHGAWAVNFNMSLRSYEEPYISSVAHLLDLAMHSPWSPKPTFCLLSSVASVLREKNSPVREVLYDWEATSDMGYGQSKWVAEKICDVAAQHAQSHGVELPVKILRIGQVAGDTRYGMWNPTETIPIMVQSAMTTGTLPITEGPLDTHFWLPVDLAAASIVELALQKPLGKSEGSASVFHVSNTTPVRWSSEFLPALRRHGMLFEAVPVSDWLRLLEKLNLSVEDNPACRLLEWFKIKYEPKVDSEVQDNNLEMDLTNSRQCSSSLRSGVQISDELIGKFLTYWTQLESWKALKEIAPH
jgi:thioester reductase-like protein